MKRFDKNIIIFIIAVVIVLVGLVNGEFAEKLLASFDKLTQNFLQEDTFAAFAEFTDDVEAASSQGLSYHKEFVDINSAVNKNMGTVVVTKDNLSVVKSKTGYLSYVREKITKEILSKRAKSMKSLYEISKDNNADFLYVMAPAKGYYMEYPENIEDYNKENCDAFLLELEKENVPFYSLIGEMEKEEIPEEELFFVTDHHWKPEYAFWAAEKVAAELWKRYGFDYAKDKLNIGNYNQEVYEDWFLGSQGKKTGQYFTGLGVDDITLITPKFDTDFSVRYAGNPDTFRGSFEEVLIHKGNIEVKDFYEKNPYAAYLGGDYREQIIQNNNNEKGKKVLILKDSFACAFAPFFANVAQKIQLLDMRDFAEFKGERIDVDKYIEAEKPDVVIVMYNGVPIDDAFYKMK